jgi:hypothetical protein
VEPEIREKMIQGTSIHDLKAIENRHANVRVKNEVVQSRELACLSDGSLVTTIQGQFMFHREQAFWYMQMASERPSTATMIPFPSLE